MTKGWVVITGGGSGIGLGTARVLAEQGYVPVLMGRDAGRLKKAAQELKNALVFACDIAVSDQVIEVCKELLAQAQGQKSSIVGLINNAGIIERLPFLKTSEAAWEHMWQVNMMGAVRVTAQLLLELRASKGQIINIASTLGIRPIANTAAYSATKAAMVNWTKTLALEEASFGVRVNCICPGLVDTPIHTFHNPKTPLDEATRKTMDPVQPLGRMGQPEDVAQMVGSLMGSTWVTGSIITVDGGIIL
jgi:NAD(P)-dependent dehydrogenase (short-subunit alcohol dehydrogenase family)